MILKSTLKRMLDLRGISKRGWRKLNSEELHQRYTLSNIIKAVKSKG
jgi:hypothetical protein